MSDLDRLIESKKDLRTRMKQLREAIPEEERQAQSRSITDMILSTELYAGARFILSYVSFGSEVDTSTLITKALKDQKRVFVPAVTGKTMQFFEIDSPDSLHKGTMGIPEPEADPARVFPYMNHISLDRKEECVVFVPGLAFDASLQRIGYGGGYYDRFLGAFQKRMAVGLSFKEQIIDSVPCAGYDEPLDLIVTPERAYF